MLITDKIYGQLEITDPLALALIGTKAFDRLRRVSQYGLPHKYYAAYPWCSRAEHCLGVYLLLKKLRAAPDEQIAGLIHDISHTAFSHLIDWVVKGDLRKENYQDNIHLSVLKRPEISGVLAQYGLTPEAMADYHAFGLLEREIPDLCVDRLDYSLRQMPENAARQYADRLIVRNGEIIFADHDAADDFARAYLKLQEECWGGYEAGTRYGVLADLFRQAIAAGDLTLADFDGDEEQVIGKLLDIKGKKYSDVLKILEKTDLSSLPKADQPVFRKFRYVDPKYLSGAQIVRLSGSDPYFKRLLNEARERDAKGLYPGIFPTP